MPRIHETVYNPNDFNATRKHSCSCGGNCHGNGPRMAGIISLNVGLNPVAIMDKLEEFREVADKLGDDMENLRERADDLYSEIDGMIDDIESEMEDGD